jgi:hypothetical protein
LKLWLISIAWTAIPNSTFGFSFWPCIIEKLNCVTTSSRSPNFWHLNYSAFDPFGCKIVDTEYNSHAHILWAFPLLHFEDDMVLTIVGCVAMWECVLCVNSPAVTALWSKSRWESSLLPSPRSANSTPHRKRCKYTDICQIISLFLIVYSKFAYLSNLFWDMIPYKKYQIDYTLFMSDQTSAQRVLGTLDQQLHCLT